MSRKKTYKWNGSPESLGIRPVHTVPAWESGDRVEDRTTGLQGVVVRLVTLDYRLWEVLLANGRYVNCDARDLVKVAA